jgi:copper chaperone CopZ
MRQSRAARRYLENLSQKGNFMEIMVKGMSCGHCAAAVTKALEALPGVSEVKVDLATGRVSFASDNPISPEELSRAITAAGYELAPVMKGAPVARD